MGALERGSTFLFRVLGGTRRGVVRPYSFARTCAHTLRPNSNLPTQRVHPHQLSSSCLVIRNATGVVDLEHDGLRQVLDLELDGLVVICLASAAPAQCSGTVLRVHAADPRLQVTAFGRAVT
jgi:hypothetical protein